MKLAIAGQVVASTSVDSHGEQIDLAFLKMMKEQSSPQKPLHQNHDMSKEVIGFLRNHRIERRGFNHVLLADIYTLDGSLPPWGTGFSWSALVGLSKNTSGQPDVAYYLPYPHYNDNNLLKELLDSSDKVAVGKFLQKSIDEIPIAIIVSLTLFILSPEWKNYYDNKLRKIIIDHLSTAKKLEKAHGIQSHIIQEANNPDGTSLKVVFIPNASGIDVAYNAKAMDDAMLVVHNISTTLCKRGLAPRKIHMRFDDDLKRYYTFFIETHAGELVNPNSLTTR